MDTLQLLLLSALSLFSLSFLVKSLIRPRNKKRMAPMAPGAWPVIGHLAVFDNGQPTHVTFGNMADVHGPVFMTKLGSVNVLIINSQEVAKEIYTVHDKLLNRPVPTTASTLMGYNGSFFSFSPERSYWREIRRIAISEMLSTAVVDMQHSRAREVDVAFRDFYQKWEQKGEPEKGVLVDMKQELHDLTQNISLMMIAGKRYFGESPNCEIEEARRCSKLIRDFFDYFGVFLFSDLVPFLGWLDWKVKKAMKRTGSELDKILDAWVEEHKIKRKDCGSAIEKNFLDRLIDIFAQHKNPGLDDAHTTTKAICLNLVLSGPEAAIVVLVWAVSLLVNNPHVLRKAQEELNRTIGKDRVVEESDLKDLVYLQAIFKETFRLYPPVALTAYRTVIEDFDIANGIFHVPAGTQLLVNAWKIHRDPNMWSNPEKFEPERFLTSNKEVDVGKQNYKLLPFGLGRKACPAVPLGMRMVQYILARFLHSFDVVRPSSEYVDMTGSNGLVNLKATPLEVFITPRLHKSLYHVDHKA
ncbi:Cytochrome P450 superfamily [Arabidopsis suecica]|uniref:Cytochrome P450 superfamily n=1 Tax=Arabidopsis suecica TaxID=45249 RepID=A0A8T1YHY2_ARASU|nr:Cytochrome P450 superfamily [Arabidopsis suecica]